MKTLSSSNSLLLLIIIISFSLLAVSIILPLGVYKSNKARTLISQSNREHFETLRDMQHDLMNTIMTVQQGLATLEANIHHQEKVIEQEEIGVKHDLKIASHEKISIQEELKTLKTDFEKRLNNFVEETENKISDANDRQTVGDKKWVVKWHAGAQGIMTSDKLRTEMEATAKFDGVGELAKKMLQYDVVHRSWNVVREYGGDNWLACMRNDANPQPGECRAS